MFANMLAIVNPFSILLILAGVSVGIIFGSIPGLSATMAIALFLPVTFGMDSLNGMTLLVSLYIGGVSGGLISAILLNMPGTPSSIATCFDGHPMMLKGEAMKAMGTGVVFSFVGTLISIIAMLFIAPGLAQIALSFGPFEYFSIILFSLTLIAGLSGDNMVIGLLTGFFGIMCSTVGMAPIDAAPRFTFGSSDLSAGFNILPVLIGMFALSEILSTAEHSRIMDQATVYDVGKSKVKGFGFSLKEFCNQGWNMFRSAMIGLVIGILPGLGGSTSNLVAYSVAKNQSKYPEKFGTGIMDGVVATETSNNASIGGAMVPLLTLGIPGDMATAMLLGGLMIHGLQPGPLLFHEQPELVYGIFGAMILADLAMLFLEFYGLRLFVKALKIPKYYLLPVVFMLCIVGAFGLNNRVFDTFIVIGFGAVGYFFSKFKFPVAPFIMGFILGPMCEDYLRKALMLSSGSYLPFVSKPVSCAFLILTVFSLFLVAKKTKKKQDPALQDVVE